MFRCNINLDPVERTLLKRVQGLCVRYGSIISNTNLQTRENVVYQETREVVTVNEWTDRIYQNTMQEHIITNVVSGRKMRIQKYNFPDTGMYSFLPTG